MKISVSSSDELKRLDSFLSTRLVQFSRTNIQRMISNGLILVNQKKVKKNFRLSYSDQIDIDIVNKVDEKKVSLEKWDYPLDILYQDKDFAIISKPRGIIVHPAPGNYDKTLVNILLHRFEKELENAIDPSRPGIVHRLDKDTTGIMIIPLNEYAHWKISDQFKNRTIQKEYIALTWSQWKEKSGVIDNILNRNKRNPIQFESSDVGKKALSHFELIKSGEYLSAVRFFPKTGRTHQIRVHCKEFGFSIFGDELYGGGIKKSKEFMKDVKTKLDHYFSLVQGHCLHAHSIEFEHPSTLETVKFSVEPNKNFNTIYNAILNNEI
ncbi:MAG: RluA family pseudouridine synthase [bacterium]|jgi:23S rRNA pseudouridine1911/1915/1917 synthase|nr:RluA family pseudouridine synthase [Candidatus Neomarinimicrobiota bacterium]HIL86902.1 RluA family pseudouridine synthase [Candidatus Neomarinimicrobiota bacterium]